MPMVEVSNGGTLSTLRLVLNPYINDGYQAAGAECVCLPLQFLHDCGFTKYKCVDRNTSMGTAYYSTTGMYGYDYNYPLDVNVENTIDYSDMTKYLGFYLAMASQDRAIRFLKIDIY